MSQAERQEVLEAVADAYSDAHHFWHECADRYHDPAGFRTSLNALVQAARNVTFRLQSHKASIPNFDSWYGPWQSFMAADPVLTWMRDARNNVTKQRGLVAHSRARSRVIYWYLDAATSEEVELDPMLPTEVAVLQAVRSVPDEIRENATVEFTREWQFDDLPGREVLAGTAHALRVLEAIIVDLERLLTDQDTLLPLVAFNAEPQSPCMDIVNSVTTLRIDPTDLGIYTTREHVVKYDPEMGDKAAKRYRLGELESGVVFEGAGGDLRTICSRLLGLAQQVLRRDKYHIPILWLRAPSGQWEMRGLTFENRKEKYALWHRMGEEVRRHGYDAFILLSDVWIAPQDAIDKTAPYPPDFSTLKGREEAITVQAETAAGDVVVLTSLYKRRLKKIRFEPVRESSGQSFGGFAEPIRVAWRELGLAVDRSDDGES